MLQLHIDGQRVNLPGEMSTEYNVLNPFFTNQGDYTLDIDIPLDDPVNALVYHNIHRIDHTRRSSRRTAILSDETGVIVHVWPFDDAPLQDGAPAPASGQPDHVRASLDGLLGHLAEHMPAAEDGRPGGGP